MDSNPPKYPSIVVPVREGAGAFAILGPVKRALARAGVSNDEIGIFYADAMSGDYDNLLKVCRQWVTIE